MSLDEKLHALEKELAVLRRHHRRMVLLFAITILVAIGFASFATLRKETAVQNIVRAERIEVVKDGEKFVELFVGTTGGKMNIFNTNGKSVANFTAIPTGAGIRICTKDGVPAAIMVAYPEGGNVAIYNKEGEVIGTLFAEPEGGKLALGPSQGGVWFEAPEKKYKKK